MSSNKKGKALNEQFLTELEAKALEIEEEMETLIDTNRQSRYLNDLLDVLNVSKIAFAEGYCCLTPPKEKEFKMIITTILPDQEKIEKLIQETKNLYYLNVSNLFNKKEALPQQEQAEGTLESFMNLLTDHLSRVDMNKNQRTISKSETEIEKIIGIGDKFDDFKQTDEIEDISFFGEAVEETIFSDTDKFDLICQALTSNVRFYQGNPKLDEDTPEILFTDDLEVLGISPKEAKSSESIDELLAMLLTDDSDTLNNSYSR